MKEAELILVTPTDEAIGTMDKMEAHQKGLLHRAFSVFIFDKEGRMLLQQRAPQKYHGGLLWTNACCSHPYPGEEVENAAKRRLAEELGFATPLKKLFAFTYKAAVENNLIEHEYDHVFAGEFEGKIDPDKDEVIAFAYHSMNEISSMLKETPDLFTSWFKIVFPQIQTWWMMNYASQKMEY